MPASLITGLIVGAGSAALALLLVIGGPIIALGAVFGVGVGLFVLTSLTAGLYLILAAVVLMPFATLPVRVALTPTFIDLALVGFLIVYLFQWMTGRRQSFKFAPAQLVIALFMGYVLFSFVAGLGNAMPTTNILRKFAEMLISISLAIILVDVLRDKVILRRFVSLLIILGALQALIGIGLYVLNDESANRALNVLNRFGYPGGDVLRYVEDNPELGERAIGTWVDPNAYGGFLVMVGALAFMQILAEKPIVGRRWMAALIFAPIVAGILLTQSRGAWLAFGMAVFFIALLRYRWLIVIGAVGGVLLLSMPFMQRYVDRLVEGIGGEDLATQMRFGEYKDALTLIGRYPLIGVGFTGAPERDIYLGVSSTYLKIAGATGLTGLALFMLVFAELYRYGLANWKRLKAEPELLTIWLGAAAGLVGMLTSGIFDHFYFNIEFHASITIAWLFVGLALATVRLSLTPPAEN